MRLKKISILSIVPYVLIYLGLMFARYNFALEEIAKILIIPFSAYAFQKLINHKDLLNERVDNVLSILLSLVLCIFLRFSKYEGYIAFKLIFYNFSKKLMVLDALFIYFVTLLIVRYLFYLIKHEQRLIKPLQVHQNSVITFLKYSLPILISLFYEWKFHFPSSSSPDTVSQWQQVHGEIPFSSVHAVGHTMFLRALLFFRDSYSIVILVQILLISSLFGIILSYFENKSVNSNFLIAVSFIIAFNSELLYVAMFPWKDNAYTICVAILVFSLIKIYIDKCELNLFYTIITGLALAGIFLNRHNGILIFVFFIVYFLYRGIRYKSKNNYILVGISIFCLVFVNFLAFNVYGALQRQDGTPYAIFGDGVVSVIVNDGNINAEQQEVIDKVFPSKGYLKEHYKWGEGGSLLWYDSKVGPEGYDVNPYKDSLRTYNKEIIKLYFELLPKNMLVMAKEIVGSTRIVWQFSSILEDNSIQLTIIVIGLICCMKGKNNKRFIIPSLPVLLNIVSIIISATTNENRYLLPTNILFLVLLVFYFLSYQTIINRDDSIST